MPQWQLSWSVSMLCLCLYVPLIGEAQTEFQYFESKGLPAELKSIFKLSVFIPSQEFSTYRQWKQVCVARGRGQWQWPLLSEWVSGIRGYGLNCPRPAFRKECLKCGRFVPMSCGCSQQVHVTEVAGFLLTSKEVWNSREALVGILE